jgi:hypothetical protein
MHAGLSKKKSRYSMLFQTFSSLETESIAGLAVATHGASSKFSFS